MANDTKMNPMQEHKMQNERTVYLDANVFLGP